MQDFKLNTDQSNALEDMKEFVLSSKDSFFILKGYAGTGKTTCMRELIKLLNGRIAFTAPTNKATRVLRDMLTTEEYKPETCTIYSLLGLRMEADGEVKVLSAPEDDALDLSNYRLVVVDEGSMLNSQVWKYIEAAAFTSSVKFIIMGDKAQLPPVGEPESPVFKLENSAELTKVMRHDNQILTLATKIREAQGKVSHQYQIRDDNDAEGGVYLLTASAFHAKMYDYAKQGLFSQIGYCKALAWRNVVVDKMNAIIRSAIFDSNVRWLVGDRIVVARRAESLEGKTIANTDDEGTVTQVLMGEHPVFSDMMVYHLYVTLDDNRQVVLYALHELSKLKFERRRDELSRLAKVASNRRKAWAEYWHFNDSFHDVRYGYAITVHRSQGSTYKEVFVDRLDITKNPSNKEALQCLYVAVTRPQKRLFIC